MLGAGLIGYDLGHPFYQVLIECCRHADSLGKLLRFRLVPHRGASFHQLYLGIPSLGIAGALNSIWDTFSSVVILDTRSMARSPKLLDSSR